MRLITQHFINGKFVNSLKGKQFAVINPADETIMAQMQRGGTEDIDAAVSAARHAFEKGPWSRMDPFSRSRLINKLADLIEKNADELAMIEAANNGKPLHIAKAADLALTVQCYRYYAGWADKIRGHTLNIGGPFHSYTIKEPVGVVGQIIPWNFPLLMQAWKLGPSLAAGCTVVMKTAEQTPLSALRVAELVAEAGFPPGVINIVNGEGDTGAYLVRHPGIDKVAFTGSSQVGYDIMRNSHEKNLKRVTLELGGKSANIISKHAKLDSALSQSTMGLFFNAGQCCIAGSRAYVHSSIYERFVAGVIERANNIKLGNPLSQDTDQGPLVSKEQQQRVLSYIQKGKKEGAKLVAGGSAPAGKGFFVQPTVFSDVTDNMVIAKEEIFGPVMSILKYDDLDDALARANNSPFGLGAGIVTEDFSQAMKAVKKFKAGTVYVNCYNVFSAMSPFGGYKDSGVGRELGEEGLNSYLESKTVFMHH